MTFMWTAFLQMCVCVYRCDCNGAQWYMPVKRMQEPRRILEKLVPDKVTAANFRTVIRFLIFSGEAFLHFQTERDNYCSDTFFWPKSLSVKGNNTTVKQASQNIPGCFIALRELTLQLQSMYWTYSNRIYMVHLQQPHMWSFNISLYSASYGWYVF